MALELDTSGWAFTPAQLARLDFFRLEKNENMLTIANTSYRATNLTVREAVVA